MRVRSRWWESFCLLSLLRAGAKVSQVFLGMFTVSKLSGWMKSTRYVLPTDFYREAAFRCLLESESKRSERSGHLCQVLLVYRTNGYGALVPMEASIAKTVIATLVRSLRDTDYIGWYREGRIVGGVLTLLGRDSGMDACTRLRTGLAEILQSELGLEESHRVQVRVCQPNQVMESDLL